MLFTLCLAIQVYQELHQYYLNDKDISIHYTQLLIEPLSTISFPPMTLVIENELKTVDTLTANKLGMVFIRVPILNDDDVHLDSIEILYKNKTIDFHLDEMSLVQLSTMDCTENSVEYKLKRVAKASFDVKINEESQNMIDLIREFIGNTIERMNFIDGLKKIWEWIKNEFRKLKKKLITVIESVRTLFDFKSIKRTRLIFDHYFHLLFDYGISTIQSIELGMVNQQDFALVESNTSFVDKKDNFKALLFGSLLENVNNVHSDSHDNKIELFNDCFKQLKTIINHPEVELHLKSNTTEFEDFKLFQPQLNDKPQDVLDIMVKIVGKIWDAVKGISIALFGTITKLFKPFVPLFAKIQKSILDASLVIPGLSKWLRQQLGSNLKVFDFFLIPFSAKLNQFFSDNQQEFTEIDQKAFFNCKSFTDIQYLPLETQLKIHWMDKLALGFGFSFQIPFLTLRSIDGVNWLNPLWNSAPFILATLSAPHNLFKPFILLKDVRLHIARLFNSFLSFIPSPFMIITGTVLTILQFAVYRLPYIVLRLQKIENRSFDSLPSTYVNKEEMLLLHTTVDTLRIGNMFFSLLPFGQAISYAGLLVTTLFYDKIITNGIKWKSKLAF